MKGSPILVLALGLVTGCPSAPPPSPAGETVDVLIAAQTIPKDVAVAATMTRVEKVPKAYVQPKALRMPDELLGQFAGSTIFEGSQITATMLHSKEEGGLAFQIPRGYRALTLPLDPGAAPIGDLRPGSYVDLVHVRAIPGKTGSEAVAFLQNVYVFAIDDAAKTVSLMLEPEEVLRVALAQDTGGVRLSPRSSQEGNTQVPLGAARSTTK